MSARQLQKSVGVKSVTRKSPGKNGKKEEQETNIDFAYGLARQRSAEKKGKAANVVNAANIRLEYPEVNLDLGANNKKHKASNTKKKSVNNKGKKGNSMKMSLFNWK